MQLFKTAALLLVFSLVWAGCGDDASVNSPMQEENEEVNTSLSRAGTFSPLNGKSTSGSAILQAGLGQVLELNFSSDFTLSDGPGLFVFLSNTEFPSDDAINLGAFVSPTGAQRYTIPEGITLDSFSHVVVHCVPYDVTFAAAELK